MKNFEKYKNEDMARAFYDWCGRRLLRCGGCPLGKEVSEDFTGRVDCAFRWLFMEAEPEEPLPCPCCGSKMLHKHDVFNDAKVWLSCEECGYRSPWEMNIDVAVRRHNEIARTMARGKECDK